MSTVIQASTEIDLKDAGVARKQPKETKAKETEDHGKRQRRLSGVDDMVTSLAANAGSPAGKPL
ncbi:hypothetical protein E1295_21185 [Nonomuraea mesophila]|uniref:Uncharacterized protein n=1 Tax=Nonomuraea mesophila TaxID=2530382 RepID=A0A4V6PGG1_9ACTN|nr:hypothetical protein [Nonomuraea mesophila]TDE48512.1 hypothetical protein E1295_21185 [Nonomuraea mesophila]